MVILLHSNKVHRSHRLTLVATVGRLGSRQTRAAAARSSGIARGRSELERGAAKWSLLQSPASVAGMTARDPIGIHVSIT